MAAQNYERISDGKEIVMNANLSAKQMLSFGLRRPGEKPKPTNLSELKSVLDENAKMKAELEELRKGNQKPTGIRKVGEIIDSISFAVTEAEVEEILAGDRRPTAIEAAQIKIAELNTINHGIETRRI